MTTCPECGYRAWHYAADIWACPNGHHTRHGEQTEAPPARQAAWPSWLPTVAVSASTALVVSVAAHFAF